MSKARIRNAIAVCVAALALAGGFFAWQAYERRQTLSAVEALVAKYSAGEGEQDGPGTAQSLTRAMTAIVNGAAGDPRYVEALDLLNAGKPQEAEPLLAAVAEDKKKGATKQEAAKATRNLASIAEISSPTKARGHYAEAADLDPNHGGGMLRHGWYQREAGALDDAESAFRRVLRKTEPEKRTLAYWSHLGLGDILVARGDPSGALVEYRDAEYVSARRVGADPGNAQRRRDLSVTYERMGDVLKAQGDLVGARHAYRVGLSITERLAEADPDNAQWRRDLSRISDRIGEVPSAQGGRTGWMYDLSVLYERIGDVLRAQGHLNAARRAYQDCLNIRARLVEFDPGNAERQRDLAQAYERVGDVLEAQGHLPAARKAYEDGRGITEGGQASERTVPR